MGFIDTLAMNSTLWSVALPGPAEGFWALSMLTLAISAVGILLSATTKPRPRVAELRLATAGAH